jgi:hypothetical protein
MISQSYLVIISICVRPPKVAKASTAAAAVEDIFSRKALKLCQCKYSIIVFLASYEKAKIITKIE